MNRYAAVALALSWICSVSAQEVPKTLKEKIIFCASCHGTQGISSVPQWPNLAGQHETYLLKQLKEMKLGKLIDTPTMTQVLIRFNEQDMEELAAYYAKMPAVQVPTVHTVVSRGEQLYKGGDYSKGITACIACHGPKGTGNAQAGFPALSGQRAVYTVQQLHSFKENKRRNDLSHIMQGISSHMSQEDMESVAHYIEGLH